MDKFRFETQLKTLTHFLDEKQLRIKDAIKVISPLNVYQKLLISQVIKLVKLILLAPNDAPNNAVTERLCSTSHILKTYIRSSITQEDLRSCLFLPIYVEQVDIKSIEEANQLCFKNQYRFSI